MDAVGDRMDVLMDGGVQRGTHVFKALALGAKAVAWYATIVSIGRRRREPASDLRSA